MAQTKKAKTSPKTKENLKNANKVAATQKVVIRRNLDYIYPKGLTDPLKRKAYRQKVRDRIRKLESELLKLRGEARKEKKQELTKYVAQHKTKA